MHSLFILVLISYICTACGEEYESCKTPDKEYGECIPIRSCAALYNLIIKRPISIKDTNFLKKSHCGFLGNVPKVCCKHEKELNARNNPIPDDILPTSFKHLLPDGFECGIDAVNKIIGGDATDLDEFPWMALITYELPNHHQGYGCGGVLISKRYVLTAAHCLKGKNLPKLWKLVAVRLGEYNKDSDEDCYFNGFSKQCLKIPPIDVKVEESIPHEKYDPDDVNQYHDIALLRLNKDVEFSDYVAPICLPTHEEERKKDYSGANLTVAGWGQTENGSSSSVKLKVVVPVKTNTFCKSMYVKADIELSERQMCAGGENNKDSCKGDSGGPLMKVSIDSSGDSTWYAAGIVSFGPDPCGLDEWPGVYTRISKYTGWILRHMKP